MSCRYTYKGKTYEVSEFDDLLRAMPPAEAADFMPGVTAVPAAPFVGKTDAWVALSIKRIIKMAVDEGYDRVAIVNGEQSAKRYSLSKQVDTVSWEATRQDGAAKNVELRLPGQNPIRLRVDGDGAVLAANGPGFQQFEGKQLDDIIGKGLAKKIMAETTNGSLSGAGLDIGGEGMKAFYDKIVPGVLKDVLRKVGGGQIQTVPIGTHTPTPGMFATEREAQDWIDANRELAPTAVPKFEGRYDKWSIRAKEGASVLTLPSRPKLEQPGFDVTPAMREKAAGGLPMFSLDEQRRKSPWLDATNRVQFAPGKWLFHAMGRASAPLLTKIGMKPMSPELKKQMRAMNLVVQKAQETASAVAGQMAQLSQGDREMVSDIIEQELAAGVTPPEHAIRLAATMSQSLGDQTAELVRLGMLSMDAAVRWDGRYLPRFYESKLRKNVADAWADAARRILGRARPMKGIKGSHLKGRGMWETIPAAELENYQALGWEVRDPDYRDGEPEVQVWRDYTREERDSMGEIRDSGFRFVMGYMQTQRDIALGRMFEGMAADPKMSSRTPKPGWVQVPSSVVDGTGVRRYGKLAGRYVPEEAMSHLSQIEEASSAAWQMYRKAMGIWKEGKTVLNPVSHMNNIVGNLTMAHFAGVSYHRADKYIDAFKDFIWKSPSLLEAKEAGLFLGTISDAELMNTLPQELKDLVAKTDSKTVKGVRFVYDAMSFFLRKPMGEAYQAEDTFFRYLIYKDARKNGATAAEAIDWAQEFIFTYNDLPRGARRVRDFGLPFFAYTYKALPAMLHTAMVYPWRFAAPAAVLWAANAAAYAIATGDDGDDWYERLQKYLKDPAYRERARAAEKLERSQLPPWMRGLTAFATHKTVRLGTDELTKLPLFIDVSRFVPGGDMFDVSPNAGGLPLPQPITPSHPIFTIGAAMVGNKDLFTGKELVDSNDTSAEAAGKRAEWMWKQIMPALAVGNAHWERGMNALAQASGGEITWLPEVIADRYTGIDRLGQPTQPKHAIAQTFGIKIKPMDLEKSAQIDAGMKRKMIADIDAEIRRLSRLNRLGAVSDKRLDAERAKAREKKSRLREGLTVDGEERP